MVEQDTVNILINVQFILKACSWIYNLKRVKLYNLNRYIAVYIRYNYNKTIKQNVFIVVKDGLD